MRIWVGGQLVTSVLPTVPATEVLVPLARTVPPGATEDWVVTIQFVGWAHGGDRLRYELESIEASVAATAPVVHGDFEAGKRGDSESPSTCAATVGSRPPVWLAILFLVISGFRFPSAPSSRSRSL